MESESKICWIVSKENGRITETECTFMQDGDINLRLYHGWPQFGFYNELVKIKVLEPYESTGHWVFLSKPSLYQFLRREHCELYSRLTHYASYIALEDEQFKFLSEAKWPKNFLVDCMPVDLERNSMTYGKAYIKFDDAKNSRQVIKNLEKEIGMPASCLSKIWHQYSNTGYHSSRVEFVFVYQELIDYYKKHNQSTEIITEKITSMLSQEGKEFSYNLNVYHSPAPIYNRQAKIVDTESNEFGIEFMRVLGMSLRNKIASGVRKTNTTYKTSPCGYIITDDIKKHLSYDIISKSIIVKYASVRKKCYEINSPVTINVYVRPDGLIVVDAELLKGSLNSIDYRHIQKKSSVLDSMFGE